MRKNRIIILGTVLIIAAFAIPLESLAQTRGSRGTVSQSPALAKDDEEKKILAVIDDINQNQSNAPGRITDTSTARLLRFLVQATNAKNVVEIGTSVGHSALWMLLGLKATDGHLTTFDIDPEAVKRARRNFDNAGVGDRVTIIEGDAHVEVKVLKDPIDLLYLDADKGGYLDYVQKLMPLLRPGGIIAADNFNMTNQDFRDALTKDPNLETLFLSRDMSVTLKKR
jgi:predicted O-methyltransferase YrrM